MNISDVDMKRVYKLYNKNISKPNMAKRLYRAKKDMKFVEYMTLCIVKGMTNYEERDNEFSE